MADVDVGSQADLHGYLLILRRRKLVVVLAFLIVLGLALAYSYVKTPVYTATATVLVPEQQASSALNPSTAQLQDPTALQRLLSDAQQFAQGDAVKAAVASSLGFTPHVSVGSSTTADVLTFTYTDPSKTEAAKVANAYATAYISASRANQIDQYTQQITALEESISNLQKKGATLVPGSAQYQAVQSSITALSQSVEQSQAAAEVATQVGPTVVNAAKVPTSPSSPKPTRNGILGAVVGLVLGIGLAFLWERLDDGLNSRDVVERAAGGLPVVGLLPLVDSWKAKGAHHVALIEDPNSNISEAYRTLRTALQFMSIDRPRKVIAVTSSVPGEGKTTLAANLAVSFARAGQRVVLVSCDLRRPRVHEFFGMSNSVGLTSVLIGRSTLKDAVVAVKDEPRLRVIASGPTPPNPAEILSLNRIVELIEAVADKADAVILDCPPVLPVSDTLLLSRLADEVLVLASVQNTTTKQLSRTVELLAQVEAPVVGVVLNRVPTENAAYGYEYGYYRADHYRSEEVTRLARSVVDEEPGGQPLVSAARRSRRSRAAATDVVDVLDDLGTDGADADVPALSSTRPAAERPATGGNGSRSRDVTANGGGGSGSGSGRDRVGGGSERPAGSPGAEPVTGAEPVAGAEPVTGAEPGAGAGDVAGAPGADGEPGTEGAQTGSEPSVAQAPTAVETGTQAEPGRA